MVLLYGVWPASMGLCICGAARIFPLPLAIPIGLFMGLMVSYLLILLAARLGHFLWFCQWDDLGDETTSECSHGAVVLLIAAGVVWSIWHIAAG